MLAMIVPTLRVVTPLWTLRVLLSTRSVGAACPRGARARSIQLVGGSLLAMIVPTLCVVTPLWTLCVLLATRSVGGCLPTRSAGTIR